MKIGLVTHEFPPENANGGIATHFSLLATGLAERGHTVHVVAQSTSFNKTVHMGAVTVHRVACLNLYQHKGYLGEYLRRLEFSQAVREKLLELVGVEGLEVVQAHPMGGVLFLFCFAPTCAVVSHLSTTYRDVAVCEEWEMNADVQLSSWMEDEIIMRSQCIQGTTRAHANAIAQHLSIDPTDISIVPHGIPVESPLSPAHTNGPQNREMEVLFLGRLERRKGVHTLMQAIPRVLDECTHVSFSLVGRDTYTGASGLALDGNAETSFKQKLLRDLPARYHARVRFFGFRAEPDVKKHLARCDLFVAPSLHESFGLVYLEAMAHGKPVIGCRTGGVPEVVTDGVDGLVVPTEDPRALADAILRLVRDDQLRRRFGKAGHRKVKTRFSVDRMVDGTLAVYEKAIERYHNGHGTDAKRA